MTKKKRTPKQVPEAEKLRQPTISHSQNPNTKGKRKVKRKVQKAPSQPNLGTGDSQNIPTLLRDISRWMIWKIVEEPAGQQDKPRKRKVPYSAHTHRAADATSEANWAPLNKALQEYTGNKDEFSGIGFAFCDEDDLVGIDLDDCRDPDTGKLDEWAQGVVDSFTSYTEVSPSGTGVKIFVRGSWEGRMNRTGRLSDEIPGSIEVYSQGRYFTVTGDLLPGSKSKIRECNPGLQELADQYFQKAQSSADSLQVIGGFFPDEITDDEILEKAKGASNGDKFCRLFDDGDTSDYDDNHSSADAALCSLLAFWCNRDPDRIEQLFDESELVRDKWIERLDYRERTIQFAIDSCKEVYDWGIPQPQVIPDSAPEVWYEEDPGPIPIDLLEQVPGFIKVLQEYSLDVSYKPSRIASWFGAYGVMLLCCQRVIKDASNLRPNEFSFLLMPSGSGKESSKSLISKVASKVGLHKSLIDAFTSGQAIEDLLVTEPNALFTPDEVHKVLSRVNSGKDVNANQFEEQLLKLYTKSGSYLRRRVQANPKHGDMMLIQPTLSILGTGIPDDFFQAMTQEQLTSGFAGRCLMFETEEREWVNHDVRNKQVPRSIIQTATNWSEEIQNREVTIERDNLYTIEYTPEATEFRTEFEKRMQNSRMSFMEKKEHVAATLSARIVEHAKKLALVFTASSATRTRFKLSNLKVKKEAIQWGADVAEHNFKRLCYMAKSHVAANSFDMKILRVTRIIQEYGVDGNKINHSELLRRMKGSAQELRTVVSTMKETGELVETVYPKRHTKKGKWYQLRIK